MRAYFGHHKCGSSWNSKVLSDFANRASLTTLSHDHWDKVGKRDRATLRSSKTDVWIHVNAPADCFELVSALAIHVVRDPRDVLVSGYYSHLYSHPVEGLPEMAAHRGRLEKVDMADGLFFEMDFARPYMEDLASWRRIDRQANLLTIGYEQLAASPLLGYTQMLQHWNISTDAVSSIQVRDVVEANSFAKRAEGRPAGEEDPRSAARKGVPGDWRNHFNAAHKAEFKSRYQSILELYGYEQNSDW